MTEMKLNCTAGETETMFVTDESRVFITHFQIICHNSTASLPLSRYFYPCHLRLFPDCLLTTGVTVRDDCSERTALADACYDLPLLRMSSVFVAVICTSLADALQFYC